jgi:hypothetical protein
VGHIPKDTQCEIVNPRGANQRNVQVRFDDGNTAIVDRRSLRQAKQPTKGESNGNV